MVVPCVSMETPLVTIFRPTLLLLAFQINHVYLELGTFSFQNLHSDRSWPSSTPLFIPNKMMKNKRWYQISDQNIDVYMYTALKIQIQTKKQATDSHYKPKLKNLHKAQQSPQWQFEGNNNCSHNLQRVAQVCLTFTFVTNCITNSSDKLAAMITHCQNNP